MAVNAKRRAKNQAILASQKTNEPKIDHDNFANSLGRALGYYSSNYGSKEQKLYAIAYFTKANLRVAKQLKKLPDFKFQTFGSLCRLMSNGQMELNQLTQYSLFFTNKLKELLEEAAKIEEVSPAKVDVATISIQDRIHELACTFAAEIDVEIDAFCTNKKSDFSTKSFLASNSVSAPVAKRIAEFYAETSAELHEALEGECEQLKEGYSHFSKKELKKFAEFVDGIISDCTQQVQSAKATRVVRKRAVTPQKLVSKIKYMREFAELKLKSCNPVDIIGSSELWVYNTKYRKLQVYKAESSLTVKGTTILGFDIKQSKSLTLRKPEEFFKGLSMGKRALNGAIKNITTKPTVPNGRVNEECILLGAF